MTLRGANLDTNCGYRALRVFVTATAAAPTADRVGKPATSVGQTTITYFLLSKSTPACTCPCTSRTIFASRLSLQAHPSTLASQSESLLDWSTESSTENHSVWFNKTFSPLERHRLCLLQSQYQKNGRSVLSQPALVRYSMCTSFPKWMLIFSCFHVFSLQHRAVCLDLF